MTGLLLDTDLTEEQRRYAEIVRSSAEALLASSTTSSTSPRSRPASWSWRTLDFDLRATARGRGGAAGRARPREGPRARSAASTPRCPPSCAATPGACARSSSTWCGNAIKFTRAGRGRDRGQARSRKTTTAIDVRFEVRDTGIGIPAGQARAPLQRLPAGGRLDHAAVRRHRAGPGHLQAPGRADGRRDRRRERRGPGSTFWFTAVLGKQPPRRGGRSAGRPAGRAHPRRGRQRHEPAGPRRAAGVVGRAARRRPRARRRRSTCCARPSPRRPVPHRHHGHADAGDRRRIARPGDQGRPRACGTRSSS